MTDGSTPGDHPYTVALNIDGPRDPEYLLEVLQAAAQAIRVANHVSRDRAAIGEPADAWHAILELVSVAERLPQLCEQIGGWLEAEREAGRIAVPSGTMAGQPDLAVLTVTEALAHAGTVAEELRAVLNAAANVASTLAAASPGLAP